MAKPDAETTQRKPSLWRALRARRFFRPVGAYVVGALVAMQVASVTFEPLGVPGWGLTLLATIALIGLPVVGYASWVYDYDADTGQVVQSHPRYTAWRAVEVILAALFVVLSVVTAYWVWSHEPGARETYLEQTKDRP